MAKKVQENLVKIPFDIMGRSKIWFVLSLLIIIPGIFCMFTKGFNFGIDFTGGTIMDLRFDNQVTLTQVREVMKSYNLDNATIQLSGEASNIEASADVMIRTADLEENERKEIMASLREQVGPYTVLREEKVGATIGGELITDAVMATVLSWVLIVIYVSYRFEWRFGLSAILALVHDILIVLSVFSFTQKQVDSSFVAAVLTCLFTTFALYFFGGDTTKDFAFALLIGFFSGCYSSIFIASPMWVLLRNKFEVKHHTTKSDVQSA